MKKQKRITIKENYKPNVVIMSYKRYKQIQYTLNIAEDIILGFNAHQRYLNSSKSDFINIKKLMR